LADVTTTFPPPAPLQDAESSVAVTDAVELVMRWPRAS
jgi:hypothetical protein